MPPGARKRKAARKKKAKENNINPSTNNPQGNDGLKSRDGKGSDRGEGNSPAFHEHGDHRNPFNDGSEDLEERPSATQPCASDVETLEEVPNDTSKELCYENGNGGDTSKGESLAEKNSEDGNCNSVEEAIASHEFVNSIDSSPSKMTLITEMAPAEETVNSAADSSVNLVTDMASVSEVEKSDTGSVLLEKSVVHPVEVTNVAMKINEDNAYSLTNENVTMSSVEEPKPKECDSKMLTSLSASPFTKFTNGAEHIKDCKTAKRSENQPHVALAPDLVQKTSWLSCCGLFEVLSSSNR
ncbi:hypothetical protein JHK82_013149 [Glycine max]|uniref:Uncharacterized protein n=2 Tax=Glycine subgen. Soja TaxID=1462606 RepID=I1K450_SOYBN|nr:uncharacterized protein LOC100527620 [Glycine max]XP_028232920.1 uncharacterized protein LOC114412984 [Glycine soja]KAG5029559.1 hypothetical protein JHK87_013073 [Glycine soja]KAG5155180.1 hypothetical protein JHK82_013149 [Glycine max]KAH1134748.1 hypothetical protein GYH30_012868 [Glycine max]KHN06452.1 hypothetical protein glysoja_010796 [Glycine soja]KRH59071.1 hypothetical protein GLYMA_05G164200v4 [Glycine max]|eukprot:NP_001235020.2 uncharacterized protein LOC100527620 [Glycine max]